MEKYCPNVIFINHSNPMGVLCRAVTKYTGIKVIGLCHGVQEGILDAARILEVPYEELECVWVGTNHYYWFTRVVHKGRDLYPELMRRMREMKPEKGTRLSAMLSRIYGYHIVYRDDGHIFEFYPYATQVYNYDKEDTYGFMKKAAEAGFDCKKPVKPVKSVSTEKEKQEFYRDFQSRLDEVDLNRKPDAIHEDVDKLLTSIANGNRNVFILNLPNNGAVPNLPAEMIVETEAVTDSTGVRPVYMDKAPVHLKGLLEKRFAWQELVADAAVKGDKNLALQALLLDEMAILPDRAESMLEELLAASKDLLPRFK